MRREQFVRCELVVMGRNGDVDDGAVYLHSHGDGYTPAGWPDAESALMDLEAAVDFLRVVTAEEL